VRAEVLGQFGGAPGIPAAAMPLFGLHGRILAGK
jgi:hypothetical protein